MVAKHPQALLFCDRKYVGAVPDNGLVVAEVCVAGIVGAEVVAAEVVAAEVVAVIQKDWLERWP